MARRRVLGTLRSALEGSDKHLSRRCSMTAVSTPPTTTSVQVRAFESKRLRPQVDAIAPDGSDVRILLGLAGGGMAHFELAAGQTSSAMTHRTVEEIWFFLTGRGEMWLRQGEREEIVDV